ncbi:MAG: outer membrane protein transport protein, partial [Gammaproteobacteria bacterium]|nr:outer membrane protein transport protein [Gammaproteobacteria bacterium]
SKIGNTLDEYAGLFTNGGELDIPASANIGVAFKVSDNTTITADIQQIWYSDVDAIGNSSSLINGCFAGNAANCFGGSQGAGFGWEDMTVFRVGIEHTSGDWTWRAGFGTGDQPIPEDEVTINVLAPGVVEDHFTLGFTKKTAGGNELSVDLMIAPSVTVSGPHLFVPGRTVDITMKQYQVGASFSW